MTGWRIPLTAVVAAATLLTAVSSGAAMQLETVMPPLAVAEANASTFATPLAYRDGVLYTANVEPGDPPPTRLGLHTVVRRGERGDDGQWQWRSYLLDDHTVDDAYHTEPSVGLDARGYLHVAYNMHYLPWQYAVSKQPASIDAFVFRGQYVAPAERDQALRQDVAFPGPGTAAIPGNQITYPAFFSDREQRLYVTYRYAVKPKRNWFDRVFAGGIARYDAATQHWQPIGGAVRQSPADVSLPKGRDHGMTYPFAMAHGWWVYQIRLAFDADNGLHAAWLWRQGNAGTDTRRPSYAYSPAGERYFYRADGSRYSLPITRDAVDPVGGAALARRAPKDFYHPLDLAVSPAGNPRISVQAIGGRRYAVRLGRDKQWRGPVTVGYNARQTLFDGHGYQWAFATGLTVLRRAVDDTGAPRSDWHKVFHGGGLCNPRVVAAHDRRVFYIHANILDDGACRDERVTIVRLSGTP